MDFIQFIIGNLNNKEEEKGGTISHRSLQWLKNQCKLYMIFIYVFTQHVECNACWLSAPTDQINTSMYFVIEYKKQTSFWRFFPVFAKSIRMIYLVYIKVTYQYTYLYKCCHAKLDMLKNQVFFYVRCFYFYHTHFKHICTKKTWIMFLKTNIKIQVLRCLNRVHSTLYRVRYM